MRRGRDAVTFEELVAEGSAVPVEGWDFSWFDGRATEERPPWGYAHLMGERMAGAASALDVQTGGGEVLATVARPPALLVATESWPPNVALARARPAPAGCPLVAVADAPALPFADASFDLVTSRHPVVVLWEEIARVLRPGATYLSQQIGAGSNRELTDFIMGPQRVNQDRSPERARVAAAAAGLEVVRLEACALRVEFFDVAAVVHFLRKVPWTVPGFTRRRLRRPAPPHARADHARGRVRVHRPTTPRRARRPVDRDGGPTGAGSHRRRRVLERMVRVMSWPQPPPPPPSSLPPPGWYPDPSGQSDAPVVGRVDVDGPHRPAAVAGTPARLRRRMIDAAARSSSPVGGGVSAATCSMWS